MGVFIKSIHSKFVAVGEGHTSSMSHITDESGPQILVIIMKEVISFIIPILVVRVGTRIYGAWIHAICKFSVSHEIEQRSEESQRVVYQDRFFVILG
jgi:hypothetical protein